MFDPSSEQHDETTICHQQNLGNIISTQEDPDLSGKESLPHFPYCFSPNSLQKSKTVSEEAIAPSNTVDAESPCRFDTSQGLNYDNVNISSVPVNSACLTSPIKTTHFKCELCGSTFNHLTLLNHHKRTHSEEHQNTVKLLSCGVSNSSFAKCDLKAHKYSLHGDKICEGKSKVEKQVELSQGNCCDNSLDRTSCDEDPPEPDSNRRKFESPNQNKDRLSKRKNTSIIKCEKCDGKGIIFIGMLKNQLNKPFKCHICDGTFSRYSSLWSHRKLHSGEKPFKCDYCGVAFARAAYLKNHNRVHTGERPYKCTVCGMQFSQAPHLKSHERIHSGEKPYECDICNKSFARYSTLWNHKRIHSGEKPYKCNICSTSFNQASHLRNHAKVHTAEKPHRCDICHLGFSNSFALKRHRGIHEKYGQTCATHQSSQALDGGCPAEGSWKQTHSNLIQSNHTMY